MESGSAGFACPIVSKYLFDVVLSDCELRMRGLSEFGVPILRIGVSKTSASGLGLW